MKIAVYKKCFLCMAFAIGMILSSCMDGDKELIKVLEPPAWIDADVKRGGFVTLTWAPVEGAVEYYIYSSKAFHSWEKSWERPTLYDTPDIKQRIGIAETTTFSHYNENWRTYCEYGVCMVDAKGNIGQMAVIGVAWPK